MGQVTTVGQVKTHQTVVRTHDGLVDLKVGGRARQALDVDTPLLGVKTEGLESASLAGELNSVNVLVTAVVAGTGVTLGVLVAHGRTQSIEDGARGDVLRGNQKDGLALALNLLLHDLGDLRVSLDERLLHELLIVSTRAWICKAHCVLTSRWLSGRAYVDILCMCMCV